MEDYLQDIYDYGDINNQIKYLMKQEKNRNSRHIHKIKERIDYDYYGYSDHYKS